MSQLTPEEPKFSRCPYILLGDIYVYAVDSLFIRKLSKKAEEACWTEIHDIYERAKKALMDANTECLCS